jgi:hypothetical protein
MGDGESGLIKALFENNGAVESFNSATEKVIGCAY